MLDIKMFKNTYFFYTLILSSFLVICIGTGLLILRPDSMIINYITLVAMALYCLILKFNKTLANFIYVIHLSLLIFISFLIRLEYIPVVIMCLGLPAYLFNEVKMRDFTYRIAKYLRVDKTYSKRKYFLYLIPIVAVVIGFIIYVADNSDKLLTVYDMIGAASLFTALYYVFKDNDVNWTFRIAYNTIMLLIFHIMYVDPILLLLQIFKVLVCIICFFEIQYDKEKIREIKNKNNNEIYY